MFQVQRQTSKLRSDEVHFRPICGEAMQELAQRPPMPMRHEQAPLLLLAPPTLASENELASASRRIPTLAPTQQRLRVSPRLQSTSPPESNPQQGLFSPQLSLQTQIVQARIRTRVLELATWKPDFEYFELAAVWIVPRHRWPQQQPDWTHAFSTTDHGD